MSAFTLGLKVIDPIRLRGVCCEIDLERPVNQKPAEVVYLMTFSFKGIPDSAARNLKTARFIGRKGQRLRAFQDKYHVRVNTIATNSRTQLCRKLIKIHDNNNKQHKYSADELHLFIKEGGISAQEKISIEEIKKKSRERWNQTSTVIHPRRSFRSQRTISE